jgi:hypothetical protein
MRLEPVQLGSSAPTEIQAVDVNGVEETPPELGLHANRAADQRGPIASSIFA